MGVVGRAFMDDWPGGLPACAGISVAMVGCACMFWHVARAHRFLEPPSISHLTHFVVRQQQLAPAQWYDCVTPPNVCCGTQFRDATGFSDQERSTIYRSGALCYGGFSATAVQAAALQGIAAQDRKHFIISSHVLQFMLHDRCGYLREGVRKCPASGDHDLEELATKSPVINPDANRSMIKLYPAWIDRALSRVAALISAGTRHTRSK